MANGEAPTKPPERPAHKHVLLSMLALLVVVAGATVFYRAAPFRKTSNWGSSCGFPGILPWDGANIDGVDYGLMPVTTRAGLRHKCNNHKGNTLLPDCTAWAAPELGPATIVRTFEPFYTDGTCDGSKGGAHIAGAPDPFRSAAYLS
jgi:hypothetical protein